jgi:hypothetical protein
MYTTPSDLENLPRLTVRLWWLTNSPGSIALTDDTRACACKSQDRCGSAVYTAKASAKSWSSMAFNRATSQ